LSKQVAGAHMSVPTVVFRAAGFDTCAAVRLKEQFDAQDLLLHHVATGVVTQEILRDEFGIAQLGKRLKVLDAARSYQVAQQQETTTTMLSGPRSWVLGRYLNAGIFIPVHDMYSALGVATCYGSRATQRRHLGWTMARRACCGHR
jgi:hypothetical protein